MMMILFLLFVGVLLLAWYGKKKPAFVLFLINIGLCIFWFKHHVTDPIPDLYF